MWPHIVLLASDDVVGTTTANCTKAAALWQPLTGFYAAEPAECEPGRLRRK